jgi:hypothetical protein
MLYSLLWVRIVIMYNKEDRKLLQKIDKLLEKSGIEQMKLATKINKICVKFDKERDRTVQPFNDVIHGFYKIKRELNELRENIDQQTCDHEIERHTVGCDYDKHDEKYCVKCHLSFGEV